ncbi:MAG: hypothetical protein BGN92_11145 [Sphingobacteriales bacterium 41-5]|nr:MAG: hypothetical protein BGN92_11145 [Sphingobacteriales bacterium 41-5]
MLRKENNQQIKKNAIMKNLKLAGVFLSLFTISGFLFVGCSSDKGSSINTPPKTNDCSSVSAKFSADVMPIIQSKCTGSGCHNATDRANGFAFTSYAAISAQAAAINSAVQSGVMPKVGSLTAEQKLIIKCWATSGALNN